MLRIKNSLVFWERCRIPFNLLLGIVVAFFWGRDIVMSGPSEWLGALVVLTLFGGLANLLFSVVYPFDVMSQFFLTGRSLSVFRWGTFSCGLLLAVMLELFVILSPGIV